MRELADISVFNSISSHGGSSISVNNGIGDAISAVFTGLTKGIGASAGSMLGAYDKSRKINEARAKNVPLNIKSRAIDIGNEFGRYVEPLQKLSNRVKGTISKWTEMQTVTDGFWTNYVVPAGRVLTEDDVAKIANSISTPFLNGLRVIRNITEELHSFETKFDNILNDIKTKQNSLTKSIKRNWLGMRGKDTTAYRDLLADKFVVGPPAGAYRSEIRKIMGPLVPFASGNYGNPEPVQLKADNEISLLGTDYGLRLSVDSSGKKTLTGVYPNGRTEAFVGDGKNRFNKSLSEYTGGFGIGRVDFDGDDAIVEFSKVKRDGKDKKNHGKENQSHLRGV